MRRIAYLMLLAIWAVGLISLLPDISKTAFAEDTPGIEPVPVISMGVAMVKMDPKAKILIMGSGFQPGQEVRLLFTTSDGSKGDIGYALKPIPVANEVGTWITTWSCGRYIQKKLITPGAYTITATDADYKFLAHVPVGFFNE